MQYETVPGGGARQLQPGGQAAGRMRRYRDRGGPKGGDHAGGGEPESGAAELLAQQDESGKGRVQQRATAVQKAQLRGLERHGTVLYINNLARGSGRRRGASAPRVT